MKIRQYEIGSLIVLGAVMLCVPVMLSGAVDKSPVTIIRERNEAVKKILEASGDDVDEQTKEELKDIINGMMDFHELSRLGLGKYWDKRTDKEKAEFVNVFQQLIRNSSVRKLEIYKADRVEYEDAVIRGDKATVTTIAYKGRKDVEIIYKMHRVDGEWKVYDMVIDGVSTARNYRDSFYKQIAKSSYEEMYKKLVKRLEKKN